MRASTTFRTCGRRPDTSTFHLATQLSPDGLFRPDLTADPGSGTVTHGHRDKRATAAGPVVTIGAAVVREAVERSGVAVDHAAAGRGPSLELADLDAVAVALDHAASEASGQNVGTRSWCLIRNRPMEPLTWGYTNDKNIDVAVAVGFEPTEELPPHTLSRRAP